MIHALRAFVLTFSSVILVLILLLGLFAVDISLRESGFSSGELFSADFSEGVFSGEILGNPFRVDFSPFREILPVLEKALFLLPAPFLLLIKLSVLIVF